MTLKQKRLIENYIRLQVKKRLNEGLPSSDLFGKFQDKLWIVEKELKDLVKLFPQLEINDPKVNIKKNLVDMRDKVSIIKGFLDHNYKPL